MPLIKGRSRAIISQNIREMQDGHPHDQAVAAALHTAYDRAGGGAWIAGRHGYAIGGGGYSQGNTNAPGTPNSTGPTAASVSGPSLSLS
jgi:hypothetical protein